MTLIVKIVTIASLLTTLGFYNVRFFPEFKDEKRGHNGYLTLGLIISMIGFLFFSVIYIIISPWWVSLNEDKTSLFSKWHWVVIPLTLLWTLFIQFDFYARANRFSALGPTLKEFWQRVLIGGSILAFLLFNFSFDQFFIVYCLALALPTLFIGIAIYQKGYFFLEKVNLKVFNKETRAVFYKYSFFSLISGIGAYLVITVDAIMVNAYLGLEKTGIYAIASFFSSFIVLGGRLLSGAASPLISEAFKERNFSTLQSIYAKSCSKQYIIGLFFFTGIWLSRRFIEFYLPDYEGILPVLFWLCLGGLIEMLTGLNTTLIAYSNHYQYNLYFVGILGVLVVIGNMVFIPLYGMVGSAFVSAFALATVNLLRYIFLNRKYGFQPFVLKDLLVPTVLAAPFLAASYIFDHQLTTHPVLALVILGGAFSLVYVIGIYFSKISEELNNFLTPLLPTQKQPKSHQ